jgi:signal transduction histidine kinase
VAARAAGCRPLDDVRGRRPEIASGAVKIFTARRWAVDVAIAILVTVLELCWAGAGSWGHAHRHMAAPGVIGYLLITAGGLSLLARRRFPVAVLAVTLATALWGETLQLSVQWPALLVAFFTAVLARKRAAAIASLILGYVISIWPPWRIGSAGHSAASALGLLAGLITLLSLAELNRAWQQRALAVRLGREEETRRRASEQRLAIARDLHDVVAHNISVINVQANTALHLMDRQPERAREALTAIHDVSRQALAELRSVLGVLRTDADGLSAPLAPSPGIGRLGELAAGTAGIDVLLVTGGTPRPVPAGVDVAAYRIVQEALTNSVRHSGGGSATVRLRYEADAVTIEVHDDGVAGATTPAAGRGGGNGVAGMTERALALGGTLEAGPARGGGYRVMARLPAAGERHGE